MAADSGIARDQLRAFIERIERMEEEKKAISADIKEIYGEAKGNGFDVKVLREIVKIRKQDASERAEHEAILELYLAALGMIPSADDDDDSEDSEDESVPIYARATSSADDDLEAKDRGAERAQLAFERAAARSGYSAIGFDTDGTV